MHVLITFLGDEETKTTKWRLQNAAENENQLGIHISTPFLWKGLIENPAILGGADVAKTYILGTTGSAWHTLFKLAPKQTTHTIEKTKLKHSVKACGLKDISELAYLKNQILDELNVVPHIISDAFSRDQQITILKALDDLIPSEAEELSIDVTHSFRHLPMLAIVIALYLETRRPGLTINTLIYGAFGAGYTSEYKPIVKLDGLLEIIQWVMALKTFDKDGDYSVFSTLLEQDGLDKKSVMTLKNAAFSERAMHLSTPHGAIHQLEKVCETLEKETALSGISSLFREELQRRLSWSKPELDAEHEDNKASKKLYLQQQALAKSYFEKGHYMMAVIYMLEAVTSKHCNSQQLHDYEGRKKVLDTLRNKATSNGICIDCNKATIDTLARIRNRYAHASFHSTDEEWQQGQNTVTIKATKNANNNKSPAELLEKAKKKRELIRERDTTIIKHFESEDKMKSILSAIMENLFGKVTPEHASNTENAAKLPS